MALARQAAGGSRQSAVGSRSALRAGTPALRFVRVHGRPSRAFWRGVIWWGAAALCAAACWASPLLGAVCIWAFVRAWDAARPYERVERLEGGRHGR